MSLVRGMYFLVDGIGEGLVMGVLLLFWWFFFVFVVL